MSLALIGGGLQAFGGLLGAAKKRKALKNQQKRLEQQKGQAFSDFDAAQSRFTDQYGNIISGLEGMADLGDLQNLDLNQARGLYGGLVDEARGQQAGLLDTARGIGDEFKTAQAQINEQSLQRGQDRLAMASGGRVQGEELALDQVRRGSANAVNQIKNIGGTGSNVLAAINQTMAGEANATRNVNMDFGRMREAKTMQAQNALINSEARADAGTMNALGHAGNIELGAMRAGNQNLLGAMGQQAGFEGQATMAEVNSANQNQLAQLNASREKSLTLAGYQSQFAGQQLGMDMSRIQLGSNYDQQMNNAQLQRQGTSIFGSALGAVGTGLLGASQLKQVTPNGG